ncbi:MAG: ABC transporter substrate-binding protein [Candidatus Methylomirabilales bacterium]
MPRCLRYELLAGVAALALLAAAPAAAATLTDMLGRAVPIPDRPLRLVSLAPSLTETVFALGRGDWLVGVSDLCNYPEAAREKPRVGGIGAPDLERIVLLRPDLVLITAEANSRQLVLQFDRLGIQTFAVTPSSFPGILEAIARLGRVTDAEARGAELAAGIRRRVEALGRRLAHRPRPGALVLIWTDPLIAAGPSTFLHDLIGLAGGENLARGQAPYPRLGWEDMLAAAPEVIVVASHRGDVAETLRRAWQGWRAVPAVRTGRVVSAPADLILRPGPRVAEAVEVLARALHPAEVAP